MSRLHLAFICLFYFFTSIQSNYGQSPEIQMSEEPTLKERIVVGGNIRLFLGTITEIELFPVVGYRLTNRLSVLAGPMYSYFSNRNFNFSDNAYGGRIMTRFFPHAKFYLQGEVDALSFGIRNVPLRIQHTYTMIGAGYYNNGGTVELLYITNNPVNTRYLNPFLLRFGFIYHLEY
jgi:hypothetical protein